MSEDKADDLKKLGLLDVESFDKFKEIQARLKKRESENELGIDNIVYKVSTLLWLNK